MPGAGGGAVKLGGKLDFTRLIAALRLRAHALAEQVVAPKAERRGDDAGER